MSHIKSVPAEESGSGQTDCLPLLPAGGSGAVQRLMCLFLLVLQSLFGVIKGVAQTYPGLAANGEDLSKRIEKYFYIAVDVNKPKAYTGECVVATYKLYVALDIQGKVTKAPSYSGFASYDIQNNSETYGVEEIKGVPFKVYTIKKVQLFALRPGLQRLEPVELEAVVRFQKAESVGRYAEAYANGEADTLVPYTLKSQLIEIDVQPLPEEKPDAFSGAVGQFEIHFKEPSANLAPGETGYLELSILGSGNWHEVILPKIKWPEGLEVFEPKLKEVTRKDAIPLYMERTLRFPFTTKKTGNYTIPSLSFSFFNPIKNEYETVETKKVSFKVAGAPVKSNIQSGDNKAADYTLIFKNIILILIPVAGIVLIFILFRRKKNNEPKSEKEMEPPVSKTPKEPTASIAATAERTKDFLNSPKKEIEKIRAEMMVFKTSHSAWFSEETESDKRKNFEALSARAEQLMYGPTPLKPDVEQLEAGWKLFKKQHPL